MTIQLVGTRGVPAAGSGGSQSTSPVAVTPPSGMQSGDLVFFVGQRRGSATITVSETGGQTWSSGLDGPGAVGGGSFIDTDVFWCQFNGTWSADPSLAFSSTTCVTAAMIVFRPTLSSNIWTLENQVTNTQFGTLPATLSAYTAVAESTVRILVIVKDNDVGGVGWAEAAGDSYVGSGTFDNLAGSDQTLWFLHNIRSTAGEHTAPEILLGLNDGYYGDYTFYEAAPPTGVANSLMMLGTGF